MSDLYKARELLQSAERNLSALKSDDAVRARIELARAWTQIAMVERTTL